MHEEIAQVFSDGGLLSQHIDGYAPRPQQLEMANTIAETLSDSTVLIAEAGTGTGKNFCLSRSGNFIGSENHYFNWYQEFTRPII